MSAVGNLPPVEQKIHTTKATHSYVVELVSQERVLPTQKDLPRQELPSIQPDPQHVQVVEEPVPAPEPATTSPEPEETVTAPAIISPEPATTSPAQLVPLKKKLGLKPNFALNIMLIIGVIFVILSGVLFATTQWIYLPPFLRTLVICSVSFVFFAASFVAEKFLKIKKTAIAFFTIGSFFLPTAVLTIGYFKMLGEYLSLSGDGNFLLYAVACSFLGIACLVGSMKYKLPYFTEGFLYCVTGFVVFLAASLHLPIGVFLLIIYLYAAILIILGMFAKKYKSKESRFSHVIQRLPFFAILNSLLIASVGFFIPGVDLSIGIASVMLSPLFLTALFRGEKSNAGVFPFALILTAGMLRFGFGGEPIHFFLLTLLSSTLINIVGCITVFPEGMRKLLRIIGLSLAGFLFVINFFGFVLFGNWNILMLILFLGVTVNLVFAGYIEKNRLLLFFAAIPLVTSLHGVATLVSGQVIPTGATFAVLLAVLFFALWVLDRVLSFSPRTLASDALIIAVIFIAFIMDYGRSFTLVFANLASLRAPMIGSILSLAILFAIFWIEALEQKNKILSVCGAIGIPFTFLFMYFPTRLLFYASVSWALLFAFFFAVLCLGGLIVKYRAITDKRFSFIAYSILAFVCLLIPVIVMSWVLSTVPEVAILVLLTTGYTTGVLLIRARRPAFSATGISHIVASILWGVSLFSSLAAVSQFWLGLEQMFYKLLFPCAAAIVLTIIAVVQQRRGIRWHAFSHVLRVSSAGLTALTVICVLSFGNDIPLEFAAVAIFLIVSSFVVQYLAGHAYISSWIEPVLLFWISHHLIARAGFVDSILASIVVFSLVFVLLLGIGRFLHKRTIETVQIASGKQTYKIDWLSLSSVVAPFLLFFGNRLSVFAAWILLCIYAISFVGRVGEMTCRRLSESFAAAFFCIAIWFQPFLSLPDGISLKLDLLVFVTYFILLRFVIWKNEVRALRVLVPASISVSLIVLAFSSVGTYAFFLLLMAFLSFALYIGYFVADHRKEDDGTAQLPGILFSLSWSVTTYTVLFIITSDVLSIRSSYLNAFILGSIAVLFLVVGFIFRVRALSRAAFFEHLVRIGSYGLMLFSLLLVVFYGEDVPRYFAWISLAFLLLSYVGQHINRHAFATSWLEPVLVFVLATIWTARLEGVNIHTVRIISYLVLFVLMTGAGLLLYRRVFSSTVGIDEKRSIQIDWLSITATLAPVFLRLCGKWGVFVAFLLLAVSMISFGVRCVGDVTKRVFATLATASVALAVWVQPMIELPQIFVAEWNLLVLVACFIFLRWMVWNAKPKVSEGLLFASVIFSIVVLSVLAIFSGELFDALFMGISMFVLMCVSFLFRKKKWFILSAITVICLSLYMTREFWGSIAWWIYLLAAGLIIIGLAASNEVMKQKGSSLTGRAKNLFRDWDQS